ncbi:unnamed protein product [Paramecium sonneborni]|uniref:Uncharacterized protein n=1 Tax=Paramecium sonneborni TaxID=65129 RepID=A0A8S1NLA2_9CILI|nr:unnamed protein product [Paramecium sonneborni]
MIIPAEPPEIQFVSNEYQIHGKLVPSHIFYGCLRMCMCESLQHNDVFDIQIPWKLIQRLQREWAIERVDLRHDMPTKMREQNIQQERRE